MHKIKWYETSQGKDVALHMGVASETLDFQIIQEGRNPARLDALVAVPHVEFGQSVERRLVGSFRNVSAAKVAAMRYEV